MTEYREVKPSVFVPIRTAATYTLRGERVVDASYVVNSIRVNEKLPESPALPVPAGGLPVIDDLAGTVYAVGKTGERVGPSTPVSGVYTPVAPAATEDPLAPPSSRAWVGGITLAVAIALVVIGVVVRLRRQAR